MSCCPPNRVDALKIATVGIGKVVELDDKTSVYVVGDESSNKVVIMVADIFGYTSGRHASLCDYLAEQGYYVLMPDMFQKDIPAPMAGGMEGVIAFAKTQPIEKMQGALDLVYQKFDLKAPGKSVGMIGFCFGCWVMFHESKRGELGENFKAGVNCHPSINLEGLYGRTPKDLSEAVQNSMLLIPTDGDVPEVQKGTFLETDSKYDVEVYVTGDPLMQHGFVSQGDTTKPEIKSAIEGVLKKATEYFAAKM